MSEDDFSIVDMIDFFKQDKKMKVIVMDDDEEENKCPCCSKQLTMGCCSECGECYDPNP